MKGSITQEILNAYGIPPTPPTIIAKSWTDALKRGITNQRNEARRAVLPTAKVTYAIHG